MNDSSGSIYLYTIKAWESPITFLNYGIYKTLLLPVGMKVPRAKIASISFLLQQRDLLQEGPVSAKIANAQMYELPVMISHQVFYEKL